MAEASRRARAASPDTPMDSSIDSLKRAYASALIYVNWGT